MKKIIIMIFICMCPCVFTSCFSYSDNEKVVIQNQEDSSQEVSVIDETGIQQKLYLETIDEQDVGESLVDCYTTAKFSQVIKGHFYFLRSNGEGDYSIYKDKGKKVGFFSVKNGFIKGFARYNDKFYAVHTKEYTKKNGNIESLDELDVVNLKNHNTTTILNVTKNDVSGNDSILYFQLYQNAVFYNDRSNLKRDNIYSYAEKGKLVQYNMDMTTVKQSISDNSLLQRKNPNITIINGKIYYAIEKDKIVSIFSYDLQKQKEKRVFFYKRNEKCSFSELNVRIDEKYIYCQEYAIPIKGGEMVNILSEAQVFPNEMISFTTNHKYIFYVGKGWKIHRIDKTDFQDTVICDIKAMDVKCTEEGVFFSRYSKTMVPGYWDDNAFVQKRDVSKSSDLFFLKEDGTKLKCIMKGEKS